MVKYVIDSNALIDAFNTYYKNDIFPTVWNFIESHIESNDLIIIDKVCNELQRQNDELKEWINGIDKNKILNITEDVDVMSEYQEIQKYIVNSGCWKSAGYLQWSGYEKADPWLIATAMHFDYTIVTHERARPRMDKSHPSKREPKITVVADNFGVETIKIYDLLEKLKFSA